MRKIALELRGAERKISKEYRTLSDYVLAGDRDDVVGCAFAEERANADREHPFARPYTDDLRALYGKLTPSEKQKISELIKERKNGANLINGRDDSAEVEAETDGTKRSALRDQLQKEKRDATTAFSNMEFLIKLFQINE